MAEFSDESHELDAQSQKADYGTVLELLEIDASPFGGGIHRVVNSRPDAGVVVFLGMTFNPVPFQSDGWAWDGTGAAPRPNITVGDVDGLLLYATIATEDYVGVNVRRWLTTSELIGSGTYRGPEIWKVIRKMEADGSYIKFELGTVLDASQVQLPGRTMIKADFPGLGRSRAS